MDKSLNSKTIPESIVASVSVSVTELRVGNLLHYNGNSKEVGKVTLLVQDMINELSYCQLDYRKNKKHWIINLDAIPLTEEWLLNYGFEKGIDNVYFIKAKHIYIKLFEEIGHVLGCVEKYSKTFKISDDIKYVHQLQNLYFSLSGSELQISSLTEH